MRTTQSRFRIKARTPPVRSRLRQLNYADYLDDGMLLDADFDNRRLADDELDRIARNGFVSSFSDD